MTRVAIIGGGIGGLVAARALCRRGVEVSIYHKPHVWAPHRTSDQTHRRILVIDGRVGFTGGICVADDWTGHAQDKRHWRDIQFRVEGPIVAQMGNAGQANYVAAKAGLIGLTKAIALEIASRGITVNAVAPGFIETPMTDVLPDKVKDELKVRIPLGRMGLARDVATAIVFLASDEAGYITGHVLNVNGGMHLG